jgi:hypothetical protein
MKKFSVLLAAAVFCAAAPAFAQVANLKVVTDANPDYSDMESMVHSITSNWKTDAEKMYALFYWDHKARRQTNPIMLHGYALGDPIRQYNDYGYTMCSTITGIKCSTWNYMNYPCRYWDIGIHTVPDVWYDGAFHHYDNSLSAMYTTADGKTIASVPEIGRPGSGPETNGETVKGYIGMYKCLNGTSPNGYLEGADTIRDLKHIGEDTFSPSVLKYRYYIYDQDRGHRYSLNLRDGEVYTRHYSRQDKDSKDAVVNDASSNADYKADPAYFIPNGKTGAGKPLDPETLNPRYRIRGNGERVFTPMLNDANLLGAVHSAKNVRGGANGITLADATKAGEAVFKVEGANVITSLKIRAAAAGNSTVSISTTNGVTWKEVAKPEAGKPVDLKLIDEVNGSYEVLVKVALEPGAALNSISFNTITAVNAHTQPKLKLGANTVYVGTGEQTGSIVFWPELQQNKYKPYVHDEKNIKSDEKNEGYYGPFHQADDKEEGYVTFRMEAPQDLTSVTYGARMYNRNPNSHIDFLHSFDEGKTWKQTYSYTETAPPWDVIHYEQVKDIPAGTKSVLFKYAIHGGSKLFSVRMEANHKLAAPSNKPVEVTFNWSERQQDYSLVKRSHTQVVDKLPATYKINVGGYDHPVVDSMTVNLKGARQDTKPGYSDGKDVGGEKFVGKWATYGKNLAEKKPYTLSVPSDTQWEAGDPDLKKLTDGRVGSSYTGGVAYRDGAIWKPNGNPEITVDLGAPTKAAAFRIHTLGYEGWDAMKGENKDKVEVLTSNDGKTFTSVGFFNFNLYWKDIPVNYMYTDEETFCAHNFMFAPPAPVEARYVKYKLSSERFMGVTEVQVLDSFKFEPFDLKVALPDPANNGKAPPKADVSPNAKKWADGELPTTIGKEFKRDGE